jgi:tetratricopeptide (TPR) repeat protein
MKPVLLLILSLLSIQNAMAVQENTSLNENLYFNANQLYFNGEFDAALNSYQTIINQFDLNSLFVSKLCGDVFYNMGNCYYRLDQKGRAILNYERAKVFLPRDDDLNYNLNYVKESIVDDVVAKENILSGIFFWVNLFTVKEILFVFSGVNFFLFLFLSLRMFYKTELNFYLAVFFLIAWLFSSGFLGLKVFQTKYDDRVVVVDTEVSVYAGPDKKDTLLFKLHEGTIALSERTEYGFSLIRIHDNKRGWVPLSSIEKIILGGN